ncbi:aminotransferase class V-fold PLP-dependent enzyme [Sinorhizobium meliloti]|uniref:pyridoxal phosphate-dependent decarboxylase family protein n=1 Tax=Rhizobium meliloti TaxID=382 RepID=UPI001296D1E7|nr:pyridoxal-dependent decarboxylase [Sinorhizobium meliloti]MDW9433013.1 aminotransferase class V-fold PLP-dependent enzyme [Sinorhizobium meliloti]MQV76840.1 aminotransferase class V-fold PLP-dependent enzyme [Sinorhizobium meliloti]
MFKNADARLLEDQQLTEMIADRLDRIKRGPASVSIDYDQFTRNLREFDFSEPRSLRSVGEFVSDATAFGSVPMTHPRYFGLFNPAPSYASEWADRIAAAFNPQLAVWSHAPAAVDIEIHTVAALARRIGFPDGASGHFTSGGSEANETAVLCALTRADPRYASDGARCFAGQPALYVSRESHLAWLKIAHRLGIGRQAVRLVETDGAGRMSPSALRDVIGEDLRQGAIPIFVASTAGTTNAGMIDPMVEIGEIAARQGIWHHVDAAWGGALIASAELRPALQGMERADSITVDAHKWFATTMGAGIFLCRAPKVLSEVFRVSADYMPSNDASRDPYVTSALWSRRFIGVRLFMNLAVSGWSGYAHHVERAVALIGRLRTSLQESGWEIANDSPMAVLNVIPPPRLGSSADVVARTQTHGGAWVSLASVERKPTVRICITNGQTDEADVDALHEILCLLR